MAYSQSTITDVRAVQSGTELLVSWASSSSSGTWFQLYLGRHLAWTGQGRSARLTWPQEWTSIDIGTVADSEATTDLSSSLAATPNNRVMASWLGGSFLGNIKEYRIYMGLSPGGSVSYTKPVAIVPANFGSTEEGWGLGGYNQGGWGLSASTYAWTSAPLAGGTWNLAIVPYDFAGNAGTATSGSSTLVSPPRPPAANASGTRLNYAINTITRVATLTWNASP